jgi:hypothetical protein
MADAARRLSEAGAKDELLADLTQRKRLLGLVRPPIFVPRGRVWRLGVLLLDQAGTLYATGTITRATETGRPTYQSASVEERREFRATAVRSGLPAGETVNFNARSIDLDPEALHASAGPIVLRDDKPFVRWSHSLGGEMSLPLDAYLRDRVDLLAHPPDGA